MFTTIHNESFNAWSMVASLMTSFYLFWRVMDRCGDVMSMWDASPFYAIMLGQIIHVPLSFGFHTFRAVSREDMIAWRNADICALMMINVCCTYAAAYFTTPAHVCGIVTFVAGMISTCSVVDILKRNASSSKKDNTIRFVRSGCLYYATVITKGVTDSIHTHSIFEPTMIAAIVLIMCHTIGGWCYNSHWPQRQFPRKFDLIGSSHNLMHTFCCSIQSLAYLYLEALWRQSQGL
jgi:adiponectin receptor